MDEDTKNHLARAKEYLPMGYTIVPVEPTQQMLSEGCKAGLSNSALFDDTRFSCERAVWAAMLAHVNKLN